MRTAVLLAFALTIAFVTVAMADPYWKPCDYFVDWKTDRTNCG